jgi:hypothetical protein
MPKRIGRFYQRMKYISKLETELENVYSKEYAGMYDKSTTVYKET